jgi:hypothetical protein
LTRALREAGHDDIAAQLERKQLGDRLRQTGREDLAAQLESGQGGERPARPETQTGVGAEAGEQFLAELKDASERGWTSLPGLLDR